MLRGPSLVGGILQTDEYSPWIHHCVYVEGSVLGGWYFTDRWVLSLDPPLCSCWGVRPWWVVFYRQMSTLPGSTTVFMLRGPSLVGGIVQTDEYSPWIHHCVHVEGSVLGGWYCTDRWVLSLDPPLCLCWGVHPWWVVLYRQMSTLPGSTTVFMLRGLSLVGGIVQTDEYSPWIHHCVHVKGSVLGGWYCTDRWVLSLDPPLCSCWGVRPWWVVFYRQMSTLPGSTTVFMLRGPSLVGGILQTDEYSPWIHHCVYIEGSVLGGWYCTRVAHWSDLSQSRLNVPFRVD